MTNQQHPITPPPELIGQWIQEWVNVYGPDKEGIDYVVAQAAQWGAEQELEARQQKIRSGPESPLVERVADAIAAQATSAGIVNDRPARAAILEVAAWMRAESKGHLGSGLHFARRLQQEAQ